MNRNASRSLYSICLAQCLAEAVPSLAQTTPPGSLWDRMNILATCGAMFRCHGRTAAHGKKSRFLHSAVAFAPTPVGKTNCRRATAHGQDTAKIKRRVKSQKRRTGVSDPH